MTHASEVIARILAATNRREIKDGEPLIVRAGETVELTRNTHVSSLTIERGGTLLSNGYRLFADDAPNIEGLP